MISLTKFLLWNCCLVCLLCPLSLEGTYNVSVDEMGFTGSCSSALSLFMAGPGGQANFSSS